MIEWISVKDSLPDYPNWIGTYVRYLVSNGEDIRIEGFTFHGMWLGYMTVTHWAPLPNLPEVQEKIAREKDDG